MTAPTAAVRTARPAHARFLKHIETCREGWCHVCAQLARAADVESGRSWGWEEPR